MSYFNDAIYEIEYSKNLYNEITETARTEMHCFIDNIKRKKKTENGVTSTSKSFKIYTDRNNPISEDKLYEVVGVTCEVVSVTEHHSFEGKVSHYESILEEC